MDLDNRIIVEITSNIKKINMQKEQWISSGEKHSGKLLGNMVAMVLRKHIENIINYNGLEYAVSGCNAYIDGCPIEWDLLLVKKNAIVNDYNVYKVEDVVTAIEFKTSGTIDVRYNQRTKDEFLQETFGKQFSYLTSKGITFAYITFSSDKDWFDSTKEYFDRMNNKQAMAFAFVNDKELAKGNIVRLCSDFDKYINELLKGENK